MTENRIIGVTGGLYTVETPSGLVYAKSRGVFRKNGIKPVTGDYVRLQFEDNTEPVISEVFERKNEIVRPPLANIDISVLVVSSCEPKPNLFVLDKLTAVFESKGIEPIYVFTKIDRAETEEYEKIYSGIGYKTFAVDNTAGAGISPGSDGRFGLNGDRSSDSEYASDRTSDIEPLIEYLRGKTSALIGNTGVGKSSLMNRIAPNAEHKTSEISKKLGRGRHTTREVSLFALDSSTYIADTPGFSTVEVSRYGTIPSAEVAACFREFSGYTDKCRFKDCAHVKEDSCGVREAVKAGVIAESRHESYCKIYEDAVKKENEY